MKLLASTIVNLIAPFISIVVSAQAAVTTDEHRLGPGDQVSIRVNHSPEISERPVRLDEAGVIQLPLIGEVRAGDQTVAALTDSIRSALERYFKNPEVTVELMEVKSHPVSILGAVKTPGVYQLQGTRRLLEVISMAGGIDPDAGHSVRISRQANAEPLPLPVSRVTVSDGLQTGEISLADLLEAKAANIPLRSHDVISIPRAKLIYVIGDVRKAGGFPLRERESMSVLQALSLAEGLAPTASSKAAKIMRPQVAGGVQRQEISVNVKEILAGRLPDQPLLPEDVLFIPGSKSRSALIRAVDAAVYMGTGVVIWRR